MVLEGFMKRITAGELTDPMRWDDLELFRGLFQTTRILAHIRRDGPVIDPTLYAAAIFRRLTGRDRVPTTVYGWNRGVVRAMKSTREAEGQLDSFWGIEAYVSVKCLLLHPTKPGKRCAWRDYDTDVRKVRGRWESLPGAEPDISKPMAFLLNHFSDSRQAMKAWLWVVHLNPRILANCFWLLFGLAFAWRSCKRDRQSYAKEAADMRSAASL